VTAEDLGFDAGASLPANAVISWADGLDLHGWVRDQRNPDTSSGRSTYTKGSAVVVLQQGPVSSVTLTAGDKAATVGLLTLADRNGDLHQQQLPGANRKTVAFLSKASTDKAGNSVLTVARVFTQPATALTLVLTADDPAAIHDLITEVSQNITVTIR
jgi:hypothetical protein